MGLVAGPAPLRQRRMPELPGKSGGTVAGQAECFFRVFEKAWLYGVVGIVAGQALACVSRRMRNGVIDPGRIDVRMAAEAEFGYFSFQIKAANQPMVAMASSTFLRSHRSVFVPFGKPARVFLVAIETPLGRPFLSGRSASSQSDRNEA